MAQKDAIFKNLLSKEKEVEYLINSSYLNEKTKRNFTQAYQTRLKKIKTHSL